MSHKISNDLRAINYNENLSGEEIKTVMLKLVEEDERAIIYNHNESVHGNYEVMFDYKNTAATDLTEKLSKMFPDVIFQLHYSSWEFQWKGVYTVKNSFISVQHINYSI